LDDESKISEPAVSRWSEGAAIVDRMHNEHAVRNSLFTLSGGIMRQAQRTSNRIDGLLSKMMEHPEAGRYLPYIDRNLDYLFTSLQLDMITMAAEKDDDEEVEVAEVLSEEPTE